MEKNQLSLALKWALLSCLLLSLGFGFVSFVLFLQPYGFLPALVMGIVYLAAISIFAVIFTLLFVAFKKLRWQTFLVFIFSVLLCVLVLNLMIYVLPLMIFLMMAVYFTVMFATRQYTALSTRKRILRWLLLGLSGLLAVVFAALIFWTGPTLRERPDTARLALPYAENFYRINTAPVNDPSARGQYNFTVHHYSSTVDASLLLENWGGIRSWLLGFGADTLPVDAQVWMPTGAGPFPIALIVHGNHAAGVRSHEGYDYLGELLASRGTIAVSVDQTFLNSSIVYDIFMVNPLQNEIGVRAFLLLEHLSLWYGWNGDVSHEFYNTVDFDRIALIGHSRGGEAAALAAAFADLGHYPNNGRVVFDYPFSINTVIAIAPTHNMYKPAGVEISLSGINYLTIHGGFDSDVFSFEGANMYSRVDVSTQGMKARVWIQHANHGQFNTVWGRNDLPGLWRMASNRRMLLSMEEQQQAAKVFISAFLEATLHNRMEYTSLFTCFAQGAAWLPPTLYVIDFMDSNRILLDDFEDGFNLGAAATGLVKYSSYGFEKWTITTLPSRFDGSNRVLQLQWGSDTQSPIFTMDFAENTFFTGDILYVSLSSNNANKSDPNVSFQIKLTDEAGRTSILNINDFGGVGNPLETPMFSPLYLSIVGRSEPVLQMVRIPTAFFDGLQGEITRMEWIMNTTNAAEQTLFVDDLRITRG
ncbi:MAG: hypothetical protein FWC16_11920 [Defluviitaleaceae bacterium]|nr:hypothetical protein [Defluviitaleaceae bacterium]MCL2275625.1 hypothetical protein [Defluviitaleaceae bacterium]